MDKPKPVDKRWVIAKRLGCIHKCLTTVNDALEALASRESNVHRLKQHNEQLQEELTDVNVKLFSLDLEDTGELVVQHAKLKQALFDLLRIKEPMHPLPRRLHTPIQKLKVPDCRS